MDVLEEAVVRMDPEDALNRIASVIRGIFSQVNEEAKLRFVAGLVGETGADKVASLVQL